MERRDFLAQLGIGAAFVLTASCLNSCSKSSAPVDFTLNLTDAANANLNANGGYIVTNGVVVAKTISGSYVAATVVCTHEGFSKVYYNKQADNFTCAEHGAQFSLTGTGLNQNGSGGLTVYKTTLTGTSLRVYS